MGVGHSTNLAFDGVICHVVDPKGAPCTNPADRILHCHLQRTDGTKWKLHNGGKSMWKVAGVPGCAKCNQPKAANNPMNWHSDVYPHLNLCTVASGSPIIDIQHTEAC